MPKSWLPCQFREKRADKHVCTKISRTGAPMTVTVDACWDCPFRAFTPPSVRAAEHYRRETVIPFSSRGIAWLDSLGIPVKRDA